MSGTLFNIQRFCTDDGPGIRTTVFFKGCNLRCAWCHNPESQSSDVQLMFFADKCIGCGKCREKCPNALESCQLCGNCALYCPEDAREICGREYSADEVMDEILKDRAYYEASGGGVTFSGGECMLQTDFLCGLLKLCKENGIHTAVDTAGCVEYSRFEKILPYTDLFLYDLKCADADTHKKYVGVDNTLIIENLGRLFDAKKEIWIRIPVIPAVNDTEQEMLALRQIISSRGRPSRIELLPYHAMGEHKYAALGREKESFSVPSDEKMQILKNIFS